MTKNQKIAMWTAIGVSSVVLTIVFRKQIGQVLRKGSAFHRKAIRNAKAEWEAWNKGGITEGDSATMDRLRAYWKSVKRGHWSDSQMINEAWSAAFISYIMMKSGAGDAFEYSPSHSTYIRSAVKNRKENRDNPFKAYKVEEVPVQVGDLVCRRRAGSTATYDTTTSYKSHCDLVVRVNKDIAEAIGGNLSNSVRKIDIPLRGGKVDRIKKPDHFVVIKRR